MKRFLKGVPLVAVLCASLTLTPARADTVTITYVAAAALSSTLTADNLPAVGTVAPLGGFNVTPTGKDITIKIEDIGAASDVPFSVCQENATDPTVGDTNVCGEAGTDDYDFSGQCSTGGNQEYEFPSNSDVSVFIFAADPISCGDGGLGTVGTATVVR